MKSEIKDFSEKLESSQKQINDQKNDFNSKLEEKELLLDKQIGLLKSTTEDLAKGINYQRDLENFNKKYHFLVKGDLASSKDANRIINNKNEKLEKKLFGMD